EALHQLVGAALNLEDAHLAVRSASTSAIAPGRTAPLFLAGLVPLLVQRAVAIAADDLEIDLLVDRLLLHQRLDLTLEAAVHELAEAAQIDEIELARNIDRGPQVAILDLLPAVNLDHHRLGLGPLRPVHVGVPADEEVIAELIDVDMHHALV